jgi:hypothetical protein
MVFIRKFTLILAQTQGSSGMALATFLPNFPARTPHRAFFQLTRTFEISWGGKNLIYFQGLDIICVLLTPIDVLTWMFL